LYDKTLSVDGKSIQAKFFVLATFAKPIELPIEGIAYVFTSVDIEAIEKHAKGFSVQTANSGSFETAPVVHGAGRVPDLATLGLNAAGVEYSKY
jgi:hypothetical protein